MALRTMVVPQLLFSHQDEFWTSYIVKKGGEVLRIRLATVTPLGHYKSVTVGRMSPSRAYLDLI